MSRRNNGNKEGEDLVFVVLNPRSAPYMCSSYNDVNGNQKTFVTNRLADGTEKIKSIEIPPDTRFISASGRLMDIDKTTNWADFLKESPLCKGSEASKRSRITPLYKVFTPKEDSKKRNKQQDIEIKALYTANSLKGDQLIDIAAIYGEFRDDEDFRREALYRAAKADPEGFTKMVGSDEVELRAIIGKGKYKGVIVLEGFKWYYKTSRELDPIHITNSSRGSEEDLLKKLIEEPALAATIKQLTEEWQ